MHWYDEDDVAGLKQKLDAYSKAVDALIQQGGTVYRGVWVVPGEKPNLEDPGEHWTLSVQDAEDYFQTNAGSSAFMDLQVDIDQDPVGYILAATVGPNNITNRGVLIGEFPDEKEVNIVTPKQAQIKIVKKFDSNVK